MTMEPGDILASFIIGWLIIAIVIGILVGKRLKRIDQQQQADAAARIGMDHWEAWLQRTREKEGQ